MPTTAPPCSRRQRRCRPRPAAAHCSSRRLAGSCPPRTVSLDLWVADTSGRVFAHGRRGRSRPGTGGAGARASAGSPRACPTREIAGVADRRPSPTIPLGSSIATHRDVRTAGHAPTARKTATCGALGVLHRCRASGRRHRHGSVRRGRAARPRDSTTTPAPGTGLRRRRSRARSPGQASTVARNAPRSVIHPARRRDRRRPPRVRRPPAADQGLGGHGRDRASSHRSLTAISPSPAIQPGTIRRSFAARPRLRSRVAGRRAHGARDGWRRGGGVGFAAARRAGARAGVRARRARRVRQPGADLPGRGHRGAGPAGPRPAGARRRDDRHRRGLGLREVDAAAGAGRRGRADRGPGSRGRPRPARPLPGRAGALPARRGRVRAAADRAQPGAVPHRDPGDRPADDHRR